MTTTLVTLSRYPDVFEQFHKSAEQYEPDVEKILVRDRREIAAPKGWTTLQAPDPFGFARNANIGIKAAWPNDVLLVNDDVSFMSPCVERVEAVAESFPTAGIIAPVVVGYVKSPIQRGECRWDDGSVVREPNIAFACVWLRRKMIEEIGLLDERFSCSYEDDDYCRRAQKKGWEPVVTNRAFVRHGFGDDFSSTSIKRTFGGYDGLLEENGRLFAEKWGL